MAPVDARLFTPLGLPALLAQAFADAIKLPTPMTITESKEAYEIAMDLPGVAPEDVSVNVHRRVATVTVRRGAGAGAASALQRTFRLPPNADDQAAAAVLEDGVLTLTFPKMLVGVARAVAERVGIPVRRGPPTAVASAAEAMAAATATAAAEVDAEAPAAAAAAAAPGRPPAEILADLTRAVEAGAIRVIKQADGSVTFAFGQ